MHYGIKTFFFLFTLLVLSGCSRLPASFRKEKLYPVAFYNTENLFDTQNDPSPADDAYTPAGAMQWTEERYRTKLTQLATVLSTLGDKEGPVVVGLSEIENKQVLQDLVQAPPLHKRKYAFIYDELPGQQGLQVALLYKPKFFQPTSHLPISLKGAPAMLQVKGLLLGEPVTFYVSQWPDPNGTRREPDKLLNAAAAALRKQLDTQQAADRDAKIIVLGDFTAEPRAQVMQQVLRASGRPNPMYKKELFNTFYMASIQGLGSYFQRNDFQMRDQILISKALIDGNDLQYVRASATIHDPDFIKYTFGKYKNTPRRTFSGTLYLGGYSDHFPVYIKLKQAD